MGQVTRHFAGVDVIYLTSVKGGGNQRFLPLNRPSARRDTSTSSQRIEEPNASGARFLLEQSRA